MATSFREWPWPLQALFYVELAIVLVLARILCSRVCRWRTVRSQLEARRAK